MILLGLSPSLDQVSWLLMSLPFPLCLAKFVSCYFFLHLIFYGFKTYLWRNILGFTGNICEKEMEKNHICVCADAFMSTITHHILHGPTVYLESLYEVNLYAFFVN